MSGKRAIFVGSLKGGVGKTEVAVHLADLMRGSEALERAAAQDVMGERGIALGELARIAKMARREVTVLDVDVQPGGTGVRSAISRRVGPYV